MLNTSVLIVDAGRRWAHPGSTKQGLHPHRAKSPPAISAIDGTMQCARTMEMFRRPGLAKKVRAAGLQSHLSMDIFVILAMNERPVVDQHYRSVDQTRAEIRTSNDGTRPVSGLERGGGQLQCVRLRSMKRCY
jgi:hypothetical protein